jgi:two-component system, sensor histidine kinase and response regulator
MAEELRVLIVDDDEVDRKAVRHALKQPDLQISFAEAADCKEAIATLENHFFDCIFVDYRLPDRDGLELIVEIHKLNIKSPIVVLTGYGDELIAVTLMKSGATDYLPKSQVSSETLPQVLRNAIRVYQAEMQAVLANQRLQESHELLLHKNQELELLQQQREDFIAHLTHDLKTPIVAADMMLKLFQKEAFCPLSAEMHAAIAAMIRSNQNLLDIVNTLLEVHCYESGLKKLTFTICDLLEITQDAIEELQPLAHEKGIALRIGAIDEKLELADRLRAMGDCLELRRMLTNLIGNSIKFTEKGFIEVRFSLSQSSSEVASVNGWVVIEVEDSGIGMSQTEQDTLFQRFRKGNHKQSGSGLGLHLVQRIVTAHQGMISVTSQIGTGSLFTILLPACFERSTPDFKST